MKKTLCLFVVTALCYAGSAAAQGFALYGAYWDTDKAEEGFGPGASLSFGRTWALDLRASYFQELNNHALDNLFDDDEVFRDNGISVLPLEVGVRYTFQPDSRVSPHLGGGIGYYILDSELGDPKDEAGYYLTVGSTFGDSRGPSFYIEGIYRKAEGTVEVDPEDLGDLGDIEFNGAEVDLDLDGFGVNAGLVWRW